MRSQNWFPGLPAFCAALFLSSISAQTAGRQMLHGHVPEATARSRVVGRVPSGDRLNLAVGLPLRNQEELDLLLQQLSDPASPNYRSFLTPDEFASRFGPSEQDYQSLISFVQANGLTVTRTHPNRTIVDVSGSVADIEKALHVNMVEYAHPSRGRFFAPDREPSLDFDGPVVSITGLDNFVVPRPMDLKSSPLAQGSPLAAGTGTGSGVNGLFKGKDFRAAYAPGVTQTGAGQTIGLFELAGFSPSDVALNFTWAGLPPVPTQTVLLDGVSGNPTDPNANIEVVLDIMMASYMAPGLSKVIVYEGTNWNDVLNRMATDNLASQLSCSWVFSPINATTEQIFKQYIAQGQSFFTAAGDAGGFNGGITPPADNPNVTVVGGTSLTTAGAGGPWQSETAWPLSGGGISSTYPLPAYQKNMNLAAAHGSMTMRNVPDVAMLADQQIFLIANNDALYVGGTSAAAPLWAGFMALVNQQSTAVGSKPIGFLNPLIYAIGNGSNYSLDLHDITSGSNGFPAISGYDLATGWGTPAGPHLISDLTGSVKQPGFTLSATPSSVSIRPGASVASIIAVTRVNGFSGSVTLTASGLPNGVTATFSPASTTGTSAMTLTASGSATPGTATITITGTSGTLKSAAAVNLNVLAPNFGLTLSFIAVTVKRGGNGTTAVTVNPTNGFSPSVALAASGLPTGVTATFSPSSTTGSSTMTLAANSTAAVGQTTVTVTGTSGSLKRSVSLVLNVTAPPNFSLAAAPATVGLYQGMSTSTSVTVTPQAGFTGNVTLSVAGLPKGVTASFSPASAGAATLTLTATPSAVTALSTLIVTGASGSLSHTAAVALTVLPPGSGTAPVNVSTAYNVTGMVADGSTFMGGGLDGGGRAYSANLVGGSLTVGGTSFSLGPANAADAVSSKTISLPAGQYTALKLIATGVNGNQAAQRFIVTYTDGTTSIFTQSLSDWFTPQNYAGETAALKMSYRDNSDSSRDGRPFLLYAYSFTLNSGKTVSSVTLPANRNVVVLAVSLAKIQAAAWKR
jgi:subtilase family serine protease